MTKTDSEHSRNGDTGLVIWLTGLSGSGKSTLADRLYEVLNKKLPRVEKLDGDVIRSYFPSTGFTKAARDEHIKRVGFIASLLEKHGVTVIASFISPYSDTRKLVRNMCGNFLEVHVKASIEECERRDVKGLYKKVRAGEITNFTGIDDPYEEPVNPEVVVDTEKLTVEEAAEKILQAISLSCEAK
ncbi:putative bifunctional SAT/APS kinase [Anaerohalosphaera lusitana]|uniref:Adenylyl-sulfate kinase n=1 Tax=Anaerohalosphaera lusitana TaxID=1936003 RepID=A0A1U9NH02_9BACT|nr:adenylyl-sulfate kinase [Anaerohalosphaera lusitana]AQT66880.1 putative bifunctional SAT/APS kinase [Anaerohalosphaera lusitana]